MRLTPFYVKTIRASFLQHFIVGDALWLFGSRADDTQKGGDIDLYIETVETDRSTANTRKSAFWGDLQIKLGEQKIDIVLNILAAHSQKPIFEEARKTGILLVKKESNLEKYIKIANIHAARLTEALANSQKILPVAHDKIQTLTYAEWTSLEAIFGRFSKLQDLIGRKIFPAILTITGDLPNLIALIDRLNLLEKIDFLPSAQWWQDLKTLRNEITHEYYEEDLDQLIDHINQLAPKAQELVDYWHTLKPKLEPLKDKVPNNAHI